MTAKPYPNIIDEAVSTIADWARQVTRIREEDIGNNDVINKTLQTLAASITAITVPTKASGTDIDTGTDDTKFLTSKAVNDSHNIPDVAPGSSGNLMTSNGTDWVSSAPAATTGTIVNSSYAEYTTSATLSTIIPFDDTIPQSSEGTQVLSIAIAPKTNTNKLRCRFKGFGASTASIISAIFQGTTCIQVAAETSATGDRTRLLTCEVEFTPGSTSSVTISVNVGASSGNMSLNSSGVATRLFGGAARSTLVVEEISA